MAMIWPDLKCGTMKIPGLENAENAINMSLQ